MSFEGKLQSENLDTKTVSNGALTQFAARSGGILVLGNFVVSEYHLTLNNDQMHQTIVKDIGARQLSARATPHTLKKQNYTTAC